MSRTRRYQYRRPKKPCRRKLRRGALTWGRDGEYRRHGPRARRPDRREDLRTKAAKKEVTG